MTDIELLLFFQTAGRIGFERLSCIRSNSYYFPIFLTVMEVLSLDLSRTFSVIGFSSVDILFPRDFDSSFGSFLKLGLVIARFRCISRFTWLSEIFNSPAAISRCSSFKFSNKCEESKEVDDDAYLER